MDEYVVDDEGVGAAALWEAGALLSAAGESGNLLAVFTEVDVRSCSAGGDEEAVGGGEEVALG